MGRIEDALHKLQKTAGVPSPSPARSTAAAARIAKVVTTEYEYNGKKIELDTAALQAQGLLAPDAEQRRLADQYRVIKRPLLQNADPNHASPIEHGNLVMVGSALSGEGKTFTCVNLCLSMAREKDWSVVLVDGDCSKPHLTRLFAAEKEPGLIDLLRDPKLNFDALVMPTSVPGLSILPAGSHDHHAAELLSSKRMDELCSTLAQDSRRMIVFDSSPLLLTTESVVLGSKVGQIVVVVRANATPRQAVLASIEKLDQSKAIGCVLNQVSGTDLGLPYGEYSPYGEYGA